MAPPESTASFYDNEIFKLLIHAIPIFDGGDNGITYPAWKRAIENVRSHCSETQISILNSIIFSKLQGRALKSITSRAIDTVREIYEVFDTVFGKPKSFDHTIWEMYSVNAHACKNVKDLYHKIAPLRDNLLIDVIHKCERDESHKDVALLFEGLTVACFLRKLKPEISNVVLSRNYETLENAFDDCMDVEKIVQFREIDQQRHEVKKTLKKPFKKPFSSKFEKKSSENSNEESPNTSSPKPPDIICNFCKKPGHIETKCFKKNKSKLIKALEAISDSSDNESDNDFSYEMNNLNLSKDSRQAGLRIRRRLESPPVYSDSNFINKISNNHGLPIVKVKLFKENLNLLLDTGASINLLSFRESLPKLKPETMPLHGINGTPFDTLGYFETKIGKIPIKFHVIPRDILSIDGLLGQEFLRTTKATIDHTDNKIIIPNREMAIKFEYNKTKTINLMARHEQIIKLKANAYEPNKDYYLRKININDQIIIPSCYVHTDKNKNFKCTALNLTNDDVTIENVGIKLRPISKIETINSIDINNINQTDRINQLRQQIRTDHMNNEEKETVMEIIERYPDIFHLPDDTLSSTPIIKHKIITSDELPTQSKVYRYPQVHKEEVKKQIDELLANKIIEPSFSPWNSPLWIVPKKKDASGKTKWRMVIDYRQLNTKTLDDKYPLPNIEEILDHLGKATYFSALDLTSGFHQIEMSPESIAKTAFSADGNRYHYLRMPFGLKNAPATFQRAMNLALQGLTPSQCMVYIDDIIIFGKDLKEHNKRLISVFDRLRSHKLKIQLDKSEFLRNETPFLGHIISEKGIRPNPEKLKAVKNFPIPKTPKNIKQFLGLVGYYRKFIPNFSQIAKPLTQLLKKEETFTWTDNCQKSFEHLRDELLKEPILQYPNFNEEFILTTDASKYAIGAVLSQGPVKNSLPIAYASRTLNPAETRYSTIERELLAIVWAVKHFRPYLFGKKFTIITDHQPLKWLFSSKDPSSRLVRWRLKLEEYQYEIVYKPGRLNSNADALSRIYANETDTINTDSEVIPSTSTADSPTIEEIPSTSEESPNTSEISSDNTRITSQTDPSKFNVYYFKTNTNKQQVNSLLLDTTPQPKEKDFTMHTLLSSRKTLIIDRSNTERDFKLNLWNTNILFQNEKTLVINPDENLDKLILESSENFHITRKCPIEIPENKKKEIILKYHTHPLNFHKGINETLNKLKLDHQFPGMTKLTHDLINTCEICVRNKTDRVNRQVPMTIPARPENINERLNVDTAILKAGRRNLYVLLIQDEFSKFCQGFCTYEKIDANFVQSSLVKYFSGFGFPKRIHSDQGKEFINKTIQNICKTLKINWTTSSVYYPQSNGSIERLIATIKDSCRTLYEVHNKYMKTMTNFDIFQLAVHNYNTSTHSTHKFTPFEIVFNKKPPNLEETTDNDELNVDLSQNLEDASTLREQVNANIQASQTKTKDRYDKKAKAKTISYQLDEEVFVKIRKGHDKLAWHGPYKIIRKINDNCYLIDINNKETTINISRIRKTKN